MRQPLRSCRAPAVTPSAEPVRAARIGPDLTHLASRTSIAAVTLTNTPANLYRWIADPKAVKPGVLMPTIVVTPQIRSDIVAYLDELK